MRWVDSKKEATGMSWSGIENKTLWTSVIHRVARSRSQLKGYKAHKVLSKFNKDDISASINEDSDCVGIVHNCIPAPTYHSAW